MTTLPHSPLHGLTLPEHDHAPTIDPTSLLISDHAVQRYRERVERVPRWLALRRLRAYGGSAAWARRPPAWTHLQVLHGATIYGSPPARPDVCLLARDGVVVTVLSRRFLAAGGAPIGPPVALPAPREHR